MPDWSTTILDAAIMVPFMILCVRAAGLRSFSKMSSYDFAVTVSFGSVLAGTVLNPGTDFWTGMLAMGALFAVQWAIGFARSRLDAVQAVTDNEPLLMMHEGRVLEGNMARARITRAELSAKLREANVLDVSAVRAVVLETTGDVSVLHGERLEEAVLHGVRRGELGADGARRGPLDA